ncbi:MAG: AI-2E family transporter [Calditrichia bacterium]
MPIHKERRTHRSGRFLINLAAFVIIVAGMKAASTLLVPFLLALFISTICLSPFLWLQRKKIPASISMLIVILGILGIGLLIGTLVGTSINDFINNLPGYQVRLDQQRMALLNWLDRFGLHIPVEQFKEYFRPEELLQLFGGVLSAFGNILSQTFIIILIVVFMLYEALNLPDKVQAASRDAESTMANFTKIHDNIKRYVSLKTLVSLATGISITIWLFILGVDFPLLWGMIAFLLNYIPNIGSIIAAIPAVLLALIQLGIFESVMTAAGYLAVNFIMGNIVEPRLMGRGLGLSTLVVFLSLIFWGWVLGPVGMLLSVPLTMVIKIALDSHHETRWMAVILGSEVSKEKIK